MAKETSAAGAHPRRDQHSDYFNDTSLARRRYRLHRGWFRLHAYHRGSPLTLCGNHRRALRAEPEPSPDLLPPCRVCRAFLRRLVAMRREREVLA